MSIKGHIQEADPEDFEPNCFQIFSWICYIICGYIIKIKNTLDSANVDDKLCKGSSVQLTVDQQGMNREINAGKKPEEQNLKRRVSRKKFEDTNEVIRSHKSKDRQCDYQKEKNKKDKQGSTKHYTEN